MLLQFSVCNPYRKTILITDTTTITIAYNAVALTKVQSIEGKPPVLD